MKMLKAFGAGALFVFVFWPWLLRGADLVWVVVFDQWLTRGNWWGAVWAGGGFMVWPFMAGLMVAFSCVVWVLFRVPK